MQQRLLFTAILIPIMLLATPQLVHAQEGMITGWVVGLEDDSGQPQTDAPVKLDTGDDVQDVGPTGSDGIVRIPFSDFDIPDGTEMDIELIRTDGDFSLNLTQSGELSDDCEEAQNNDEDDCDVLAGYLVWGRPAEVTVSTSGTAVVTSEPMAGDRPSMGDTPMTEGDSPVRIEVGGHFGRNLDFEENFFGLDGRVYLLTIPYPVAIDAILSFYPIDEIRSGVAPSFFGSWIFPVSPKVDISAGAGLEFFRSSVDFDGDSFSDTDTGIAVRFEGLYRLNETVRPVADVKWVNFEGGSEISFKFGVRIKVAG